MSQTIFNFGRNLKIQPASVETPQSPEQVLEVLDAARGQPVRAIGSLHSWSGIPQTDGVLINTSGLKWIEIHRDGEQVTAEVGAGCQLKHLVQHLLKFDLTLPSLGLIDEQTVAGATATGTHGSGKHCLSQYIEAVTLAHYDEQGKACLRVIEQGPELQAARCSLGLMGIIVSLRLRCRPRYRIEEHARRHPSLAAAIATETDYPQQQFYLLPWSWNWLAHHRRETTATRSWLAPLYRWYWFLCMDVGLHLAVYTLAKLVRSGWLTRIFFRRMVPLTVIRNWKVVDDSSAMLTMEHELFRHIEIEIFVQRPQLESATQLLIDVMCGMDNQPLKHADETRKRLEEIGQWEKFEQLRGSYRHHYPICYRRILCDDTLISMSSPGASGDEDWYSISMISYRWPTQRDGFFSFSHFVGQVFGQLFQARCHWGKYHQTDREQTTMLYPNWNQFCEIARRFDPVGSFQNDWISPLLPESPAEDGSVG